MNGPNQRVDKVAAKLWDAAFVVDLNPELLRDTPECSVGAAHPVLDRWCRRTRASAEAVQPLSSMSYASTTNRSAQSDAGDLRARKRSA